MRTVKKLILRGIKKDVKRLDHLTAYDLALLNSENKLAEKIRPLNFFDKYFLMRSELTEFKYTNNDIYLILIFSVLFILKLIYLLRLFNFEVDQEKISKCRIMDIEDCVFDYVFFIFTAISSFLDILLVLIVFYFICFLKKIHKNKKIEEKNLIVKFLFK